jgi:hypothetical protein
VELYPIDSTTTGSLEVLEVRITSECGGRHKKIVEVTHPTISVAGPDKVCAGQRVVLNATSDQSDVRFSWFEDAGGTTLLSDSSSLVMESIQKPITYFVCGTNAHGCLTDMQSVNIDVVPLLNLSELPPDDRDVGPLSSDEIFLLGG